MSSLLRVAPSSPKTLQLAAGVRAGEGGREGRAAKSRKWEDERDVRHEEQTVANDLK